MTGAAVPVEQAPTPRVARIVSAVLGAARWRLVAASHPGVRVGRRCSLGSRARIEVAGRGRLDVGDAVVVRDDVHCYVQGTLTIGRGVFINRWAYLSSFLTVAIEDGVRIGERVSIHDENHDVAGGAAQYLAAPVRIGRDSWIGAGVVILPGADIGVGCVVAAGAVVRGRIPDHSLAAGVPARVVRALTHGARGDVAGPSPTP